MEIEILNILKIVTWPGSVLGSCYIFYKSGLLNAISSRILNKVNGTTHEKRIHKLETNDIKHMQADIQTLYIKLDILEKDVSSISSKVSYIEGKLSNR